MSIFLFTNPSFKWHTNTRLQAETQICQCALFWMSADAHVLFDNDPGKDRFLVPVPSYTHMPTQKDSKRHTQIITKFGSRWALQFVMRFLFYFSETHHPTMLVASWAVTKLSRYFPLGAYESQGELTHICYSWKPQSEHRCCYAGDMSDTPPKQGWSAKAATGTAICGLYTSICLYRITLVQMKGTLISMCLHHQSDSTLW